MAHLPPTLLSISSILYSIQSMALLPFFTPYFSPSRPHLLPRRSSTHLRRLMHAPLDPVLGRRRPSLVDVDVVAAIPSHTPSLMHAPMLHHRGFSRSGVGRRRPSLIDVAATAAIPSYTPSPEACSDASPSPLSQIWCWPPPSAFSSSYWKLGCSYALVLSFLELWREDG